MRLLAVGTYGSDDPTRAAMPLMTASGALSAGYEAEVVLLGEAVYLMKDDIAAALEAVAFGGVAATLAELVEAGVMFFV